MFKVVIFVLYMITNCVIMRFVTWATVSCNRDTKPSCIIHNV